MRTVIKIPSEFKFIQAIAVVLLAFTAVYAYASNKNAVQCFEMLNHEFKKLGEDERVNLYDAYVEKLVLVVNTASKCAFTPQYDWTRVIV